jgi:hypothetical protein
MITVMQVNKAHGRIQSYTCTDGVMNINISKEQLCKLIEHNMVDNAKMQVYEDSIIIRVDKVRACTAESNKCKYVDSHVYRGLTE